MCVCVHVCVHRICKIDIRSLNEMLNIVFMLQKCVTCTRCTSCGSPNVGRWQKVPIKVKPMEVTMGETSLTTDLALCARCITLRERGNFCPLCNGCYEDDDYDAKVCFFINKLLLFQFFLESGFICKGKVDSVVLKQWSLGSITIGKV